MIGLHGVNYVLLILVLHYINDFICQDSNLAKNKSHDVDALLQHTLTYSLFWMFAGMLYVLFESINSVVLDVDCVRWHIILVIIFSGLTFVAHTITDYYTSKVTARMYKNGKFGNGIPNWGMFSVIGLDQCLHYIQLFYTLEFIFALA